MELVARRLAVKTLSIQAETLPRRVQGRLTIMGPPEASARDRWRRIV